MRAMSLVLGSSFSALLLLHSVVVPAAELPLTVHKASEIHGHKVVRARSSWRVVADYDGTPVVFRPYRAGIAARPDGLQWVKTEYAADWVQRALPRYYFNGEPILPMYPRGWPKAATARYRTLAGLP
jgi:hypothetical protein